MARPEGMAPPAGPTFMDEDLVLTAAEVFLIPWAAHIGQQPAPPVRDLRSRMGGRQCELCGGTYFSSRRVPPCSGGQQCPRAFGHRRGSVRWIDGRWVAVDLFEEILRRRGTGRTVSASSCAGNAEGDAARAAPPQAVLAPLPEEPVAVEKPAPPRPPIRGTVQEALSARRVAIRAAGPPKAPPPMPSPGETASLPKPPPVLTWWSRPPPADACRSGSSGGSGPYSRAGFKPPPAMAQDPRLRAKSPPTPAQFAAYEKAQVALAGAAHLAPPCASLSHAARPATGGDWILPPFPSPREEAFRRQEDTVLAPSESDDSVVLGGTWSVADATEATLDPDEGTEVQAAAQVDVNMEDETGVAREMEEGGDDKESGKDDAVPGGGEPGGGP